MILSNALTQVHRTHTHKVVESTKANPTRQCINIPHLSAAQHPLQKKMISFFAPFFQKKFFCSSDAALSVM
jgi:hypothetical protein